jgi:hypothetical protein
MTEPSVSPATNLAPRSLAAERMRRHRQRKRNSMRCLTIELRETEIETLVRQGLLPPVMRNDPQAVRRALYRFLDYTLGTMR